MKATFIILLFPSLAFSFYNGIPYKKTEICKKIKTDFYKASFDSVFNESKTYSKLSKAYADALKYECFKIQTTDCKKTIQDISISYADLNKAEGDHSKVWAVLRKAYANLDNHCS